MTQGVQNLPTVATEISENIKDEGRLAETVVEINSEETSPSDAQVTTSGVNHDGSGSDKVPHKEPEIVIIVDPLRNSDSLKQVDQGTSGCPINSSVELLSENSQKNGSATGSSKNVVTMSESDSSAINISASETSRIVAEDCQEERICRICHLSSEQPLDIDMDEDSGNPAASELIQLGCGCKAELGIAHRLCAEAWFKVKGNRLCEICGETARNISGVWDDRFIDKWNDRLSRTSNITPPAERAGCLRGQPFCNFLMACLVIAFVLPWFFRVQMF